MDNKSCKSCQFSMRNCFGVDVCCVTNANVGRDAEDGIAANCPHYESNSRPMTTFKIPVVWTMTGYVSVRLPSDENPTVEDAIEYATANANDFPLPKDGVYLEDSFEIDECGALAMVTVDPEGGEDNYD